MPASTQIIPKMENTITNQDIKVAIIEDRREIREGLSVMINFTDGFSMRRQLSFDGRSPAPPAA